MPVCKLVSVDYLNRTGKQGALIGILFVYFRILGITCFNWKYLIYEKRRKAPKKLNIPVDLNFIVVPYVYLFN